MLDQIGKQQQLTRTDETPFHLRDCPGNDLDRAVLDASLRFRRGLGAKSSCRFKNMQRRRAPWAIEIKTHWVKGKVRHLVGQHKLRLCYLGRKSKPLQRLTDGGTGAGRRQSFAHASQIRRTDRVAYSQINCVPRHVSLVAVETLDKHKQVRSFIVLEVFI
jgi:hypothetical protein